MTTQPFANQPPGFMPDMFAPAPPLPAWAGNRRGFPVGLVSGCIFSARNTPERQHYPKLTPVYSSIDYEIYFSGTELREETDKQVWMQLMHMARGQSVAPETRIALEFTAHEFLQLVSWMPTSGNYKRLVECLERLHKSQVSIQQVKNGRRSKTIYMHFISNLERGSGVRDTGRDMWIVTLDPMAANLYQDGLIQIDLDQYKRLHRTLSRKLYDQIIAVKGPVFSANVKDLKNLFGSDTKSDASFKQSIKKALEELITDGAIHHYSFDKDILYASKVQGTLVNRGTPTTLNVHKAPERGEYVDE